MAHSKVAELLIPLDFFHIKRDATPKGNVAKLLAVFITGIVVCAIVGGVLFASFAADFTTVTTVTATRIDGQSCEMISSGPPRKIEFGCNRTDEASATCVLPGGGREGANVVQVEHTSAFFSQYEDCMASESWSTACGQPDIGRDTVLQTMPIDSMLKTTAAVASIVVSRDGLWAYVVRTGTTISKYATSDMTVAVWSHQGMEANAQISLSEDDTTLYGYDPTCTSNTQKRADGNYQTVSTGDCIFGISTTTGDSIWLSDPTLPKIHSSRGVFWSAPPIVSPDESTICFSGKLIQIRCFDGPSKALLWTRPWVNNGDPPWTSLPAVSPSSSILVRGDGAYAIKQVDIIAHDLRTGVELWRYNETTVGRRRYAAQWVKFSPAGDVVYAPVAKDLAAPQPSDEEAGCCCIHAIFVATGTRKWVRCGTGDRIIVSADGAKLTVYDRIEDPYAISTIDAATGTFQLKPVATGSTPVHNYGASTSTYVKKSTNAAKNSRAVNGRSTSLSTDETVIYVPTKTPHPAVNAYDLTNGALLWSFNLKPGEETGQMPPQEMDGKLYISAWIQGSQGTIYILDLYHCAVDKVRFISTSGGISFPLGQSYIELAGATTTECIEQWDATYCNDSHPVGAAWKNSYCAMYKDHPPYSCTTNIPRSKLESFSLSFGIIEFAYTVLVFVLVFVFTRLCSTGISTSSTGISTSGNEGFEGFSA